MMGSNQAWIMAALLKVSADGPKEPEKDLIRPSDLPIYQPAFKPEEKLRNDSHEDFVRKALLPPVRAVRQQVQEVLQQTNSVRQSIADSYSQAESRTAWIVKYLREEENKDQRYGAVAMGGLTGFIVGARGGILKKLFYATIGTGVMGAVCFPEETANIAKDIKTSGRHYLNVAYNFFYGVKPGDPQLEVKFPEISFPKDFSEFIDVSAKLASTVKLAVMPPPSKDDQSSQKPESKS